MSVITKEKKMVKCLRFFGTKWKPSKYLTEFGLLYLLTSSGISFSWLWPALDRHSLHPHTPISAKSPAFIQGIVNKKNPGLYPRHARNKTALGYVHVSYYVVRRFKLKLFAKTIYKCFNGTSNQSVATRAAGAHLSRSMPKPLMGRFAKQFSQVEWLP